MMKLDELIAGEPLNRMLEIEELKGLNLRKYIELLSSELPEKVKQAICCYGYTCIDDAEERKRIADKITDAIGNAIPPQYKLLWPIAKPFVSRIVRELIDQAAEQGDEFCKDVTCALSPILVD